jgi:hypothetical protein
MNGVGCFRQRCSFRYKDLQREQESRCSERVEHKEKDSFAFAGQTLCANQNNGASFTIRRSARR